MPTRTEPPRMARLPHDKHGRPVPWFVAWVDGQPDFRVIKPGAVGIAVTSKLCWVCGILFGRQEPRAFVIGPMCAVNLNTAEPACHYECASYSAQACPFLATPTMSRRDRHLPEGVVDPPGEFLRRNPGVACVWVAKYNSTIIDKTPQGPLFKLHPVPLFVEWYAHGRTASRSEVIDSINSGMPGLRVMAAEQGEAARAMLSRAYEAALALVP
jgi:hypothetical protein